MRAIIVCLAVAAFACDATAQQPVASRQTLEDCLAYQRLAVSGPGLALTTYRAYAEEFRQHEQSHLTRIAEAFQAAAALELGDVDSIKNWVENLEPESMTFEKRWIDRLDATIDQGGDFVDTVDYQEIRQLLATHLLRVVRESGIDDVNVAGAWLSQGEPDDDRFSPALSLTVDENVAIDYRFYDPAIFRIVADDHVRVLRTTVSGSADPDSQLVNVWCLYFLRKNQESAEVAKSLKPVAKESGWTAEQTEELQYLLVAIAARSQQDDAVGPFLDSRAEQPPTSIWAQRALNSLRNRSQQGTELLQRNCEKIAGGHHPLSPEVLGNIPGQTSAILDQYWEVACGHLNLAIEQTPWRLQASPAQAALEARQLSSELASPSILESWRELSLQRLVLLFETGLLCRDTETWQLYVSDAMQQRRPILGVLKRLSRDYSGLVRTRGQLQNYEALRSESTDNVVALLWGNGRVPTIAPALADRPSQSQGWTWTLLLASAFFLLATFILFKLFRGNAK